MSVPLVTLNSNQISLSRTVSLEYPVKLFDILMRLAREAFMPKEFQLSRSLKTYLKEELALLDKRDRTIEKIALLTSLYLTEAEKLTNEYMIFRKSLKSHGANAPQLFKGKNEVWLAGSCLVAISDHFS